MTAYYEIERLREALKGAEAIASSAGQEIAKLATERDKLQKDLLDAYFLSDCYKKERDQLKALAGELVEALQNIANRIDGNDKLRDCEEFYRGYNSANRGCREIANTALQKAHSTGIGKP